MYFPMSQLFASGGQSIGASAWSYISTSSEYSGLISFKFGLLLSKELSRIFSSVTIWKRQFFGFLPSLLSCSHICTWLLERPSVQFCCSVVSDSLRPHRLQHTRPPCPSPTPGVYPNSCSLSRWFHPTISSSPSPTFNLSHHQGLFKWVSSSHQVAKELEFQFQHHSFQWTLRTDFL